MIEGISSRGSGVVPAKAFILEQMLPPAKSGVGSTDVFAMKSIILQNSATVKQDILILKQSPPPAESGIGKEDLPGGFRWYSAISGQSNPLQDFARGIVQIDGVKVLFDVKR